MLDGRMKLRRLEPIRFYPYSMDKRIQRVVEEKLGVYKPLASSGGEFMSTPPPEGVLRGESVPNENDAYEFEELLAKARERRIKSLERQNRLKKEVEVTDLLPALKCGGYQHGNFPLKNEPAVGE